MSAKIDGWILITGHEPGTLTINVPNGAGEDYIHGRIPAFMGEIGLEIAALRLYDDLGMEVDEADEARELRVDYTRKDG